MATIGQIMTRDVSVIQQDSSVELAAQQMLNLHIGSLLVMQGNDYAGIITETDVVRAVAQQLNVSQSTVQEIMSSPILTVEKNLSPHYARDLMADKHIRHLGVTEQGTIVGMISARDLLAYFKTVSKEID